MNGIDAAANAVAGLDPILLCVKYSSCKHGQDIKDACDMANFRAFVSKNKCLTLQSCANAAAATALNLTPCRFNIDRDSQLAASGMMVMALATNTGLLARFSSISKGLAQHQGSHCSLINQVVAEVKFPQTRPCSLSQLLHGRGTHQVNKCNTSFGLVVLQCQHLAR